MRNFDGRSTILFVLLGLLFTQISFADWVTVPESTTSGSSLEIIHDSGSLVEFSWKSSGVNITNMNEDQRQYKFECQNESLNESGIPSIGGLIYLPWGSNAEVVVSSGKFSKITTDGSIEESKLLSELSFEPSDYITMGTSAIFRDITVAPLTFYPVVSDANGNTWLISDLDFEVVASGNMLGLDSTEPDRAVSRAFWPLYQSMVLNSLDEVGTRLSDTKGSYLIYVGSDYEEEIAAFVKWKEEKGFNVIVDSFDTPYQLGDLEASVADYYENLVPPLEYILLIGDENRGEYSIPANVIRNPRDIGEFDVTDWSLTYLDGEDYFPEVLIGRMSTGSSSDVTKTTRRSYRYEKNINHPGPDQPYWEGAALVAANWADGQIPLTPVATTEWLLERMQNAWNIDGAEIFSWTENGQNNATNDQIINKIDNGTLWVTYRGWGNASQWVKPEFDGSDIGRLNNINYLPILTSFVCNTGDFGNDYNPQCFAAKWTTEGSANSARGAVCAIAPSDLHTQTKYNNPLLAGFYEGVYSDNLSTISHALLRAKFELYLQFPLDREVGGTRNFVEFYHGVYHIFGDPDLSMWKQAPLQFDDNLIPNSVNLGQNHIEITVLSSGSPVLGAYVQFIQDDGFSNGGYTDASGIAVVQLEDIFVGDSKVTITKPNFEPQSATVTVGQAGSYLCVDNWTVVADEDGLVSLDETVTLSVVVKNTGTSNASTVSATLSHAGEGVVTISTDQTAFGDIAAGNEASCSPDFEFTLDASVEDGAMLEFDLEISEGSNTYNSKVWLAVGAARIVYQSFESTGESSLEPGQTATVNLTFENLGSIDLSNVTTTIESWDESVTVETATAGAQSFDANGTATFEGYELAVNSGTYGGRSVRLAAIFKIGELVVDHINFNISLEGLDGSDPLGPDWHGYFAYDNTDVDYASAPDHEIFDLANDGAAINHALSDDDITYIDLPFDFTFYGVTYESGTTLTLSSNGWLSFGDAGQYSENFYINWSIPAVLGPGAFIAGFWDDLKPLVGEQMMNVYHKVDGDRLIIEWTDALNRYLYPGVEYPTRFAIVLFDQTSRPTDSGDNEIEVHYYDIENVDQNNNYATVGIQREDHHVGLKYTYAGRYPTAAATLENGRAIRFTTVAPDGFSSVGNSSESQLVEEFKLHNAYPNPFNSTTNVRFDIADAGMVTLSVYNLLGQEVAVLINQHMEAGHQRAVWKTDDLNLSSGLFLIRLESNGLVQMGKLMYVK
jgi:Peptidase family C25/Secretion system C-terminal sorting domain